MTAFENYTKSFFSIILPDSCHMNILRLEPNNNLSNGRIMIVIQEIFGINDSLLQTCQQYASLGYDVLCPDLFHRFKPNIKLNDNKPDELQQAFEYFKLFDTEQGLKDIQSVIEYARTAGATKVGAVGYCLGGYLTYLVSCKTDIDVCVSYYGVNIQNALHESKNIHSPFMMHIAERDEFVSSEAQEIILKNFDNHKYVVCYQYPHVSHAFARVDGTNYHHDSAVLANKRTVEFFDAHLKS